MAKTTKKALAVLIASLIAAALYRMGGWGKPFKSWMRDWIIPIVAYGLLYFLKTPVNLLGWLMILPAIALTGAACTTYWDNSKDQTKDFIARMINWMYPEDNMYLHGLFVGLGAFPLIWAGFAWWLILIRAIILALFMGVLNWWVHKYSIKHSDIAEECSRGASIIATLPILLI